MEEKNEKLDGIWVRKGFMGMVCSGIIQKNQCTQKSPLYLTPRCLDPFFSGSRRSRLLQVGSGLCLQRPLTCSFAISTEIGLGKQERFVEGARLSVQGPADLRFGIRETA